MRPQSIPFQRRATSGFVEWDDTPSFAESLPDRLNWRDRNPAHPGGPRVVYADTMPAELVPAVVSTAFSEPVEGLSVREVHDVDVFRHFFAD